MAATVRDVENGARAYSTRTRTIDSDVLQSTVFARKLLPRKPDGRIKRLDQNQNAE